MLSAEDNDLLARTGPGTPMGDFFRRFWLPIALSQELSKPDGPPIRVKIMDEDRVAFRDTEGRVGSSIHAARIAAPTSSSVATRSAGCAAPTTAGSTT